MNQSHEQVIQRHAARVLVLDRQGRVLLLRCQEPGGGRAFWITPGGGLEAGESHEQAALRELYEETGLQGVELGPCVWMRTHVFPWMGRTYRQHERFYLLRVDAYTVQPAGHTDEESLVLTEHRWWSLSQVQAAADERFAPGAIAGLLEQLFEQGPPDAPLEVGS